MQGKQRFIATALLGPLLVVVTGCASLPSPEAMKAEVAGYQLPKLPEPGKAMVYVVRPSSLGPLIRFNVFVNDQEAASEVGYTRGGQYIYFSVPPGTHAIYSKAENWAEASVTAQAGDIFYIQQEPAMGVIMARNSLFKLEDYQGKYHVKTLTLGTVLRPEKGGAQAPQPTVSPAAAAAPGPAPSAPAATSTATLPPRQERLLNADEVSRHLGTVANFKAQLANGTPVRVEWTWGNGFSMSTLDGPTERVTGVRSVDGHRLCLRPVATGSGLTRMSGLQDFANKDCYALYQTDTQNYFWKSLSPSSKGGVMLTYALP